MAREAAREVTEFVRGEVGSGVRTVAILGDGGWETTYLRQELQAADSEESYSKVVDFYDLDEPLSSPGIDEPVGERRAIVHLHENAFVIQLPFSETETVLVSLSRDAGRNLLGFIEHCRELVTGSDG